MFDLPFLYGDGWTNAAPNKAEYITVLSKATNDRVFSGVNSVGKTLPMLGRLFTVVGVLDTWQPSPKFYDLSMGPYSQPEDLYIPLQIKAELELPHGGSSHCWESNLANSYNAFLNSECINFNLWVEFANPQQKQQFEEFLKHYITQQKALGRFPKPEQNVLLSLNQWLDYKAVVSTDIYLFFYLALLFLAVCLFNAAALISNKFSKKSAEIALRRALGANQQSIFMQCMTETLLLGLAGALIGLVLSLLGFAAIKQLYVDFNHFEFFAPSLILLTITLSLISSALAGAIPSMRVCRLAPAVYLK
jgi:putative ABC transport system permease protein